MGEDCGHPNHGAADHACAPFLAVPDPTVEAQIAEVVDAHALHPYHLICGCGWAPVIVADGCDNLGASYFDQHRAHLAAVLTARAAAPDALPLAVERGHECFHGTPRACESYRCGSNCSNRFDRMHPCPACLIAQIHDLRAAPDALRVAVEALAEELRVTTSEWIASGRGIPQYSAPWFEGRLRALLEDGA